MIGTEEVPTNPAERAMLSDRFLSVRCPYCEADAIMVCLVCKQVVEWQDQEDGMAARARHVCDLETIGIVTGARIL